MYSKIMYFCVIQKQFVSIETDSQILIIKSLGEMNSGIGFQMIMGTTPVNLHMYN